MFPIRGGEKRLVVGPSSELLKVDLYFPGSYLLLGSVTIRPDIFFLVERYPFPDCKK